MADRTLTINHADGGSETYTINRDKFAGVREMSRGYSYGLHGVTAKSASTYDVIPINNTNFRFVSTMDTDLSVSAVGVPLLDYSLLQEGMHTITFNVTSNDGGGVSGLRFTKQHNTTNTVITEGLTSLSFDLRKSNSGGTPKLYLAAEVGSAFDVTISDITLLKDADTVGVDHTPTDAARVIYSDDKAVTLSDKKLDKIRTLSLDGNSIEVDREKPTLHLTEAEYESLTEYEDRVYSVKGVGTYQGATALTKDAWSYDPSDIHVTKTGNDTTGDGSINNPYLTISKGYDIALANDGGTVWVHGGTYAEDTGNGYFLKASDNPTSRLYIKGRPDQSVVMTNVSGSYLLRFNSSNSNITFQGIEFKAVSNVSNFFYSAGSQSLSNFQFIECVFTDEQNTSTSLNISTSLGLNDLAIKRCTFTSNGNFSTNFRYVNNITYIGNTVSTPNASASFIGFRLSTAYRGNIYFSNNTINTGNGFGLKQEAVPDATTVIYCNNNTITGTPSDGMYFTGGASGITFELYIDNNSITSNSNGIRVLEYVNKGEVTNNKITASGSVPLGFPADSSDTGLVGDVLIANNEIQATGAGGHGLLVSANSENVTILNNQVTASNGGAYALVLKGDNHTVAGNDFISGYKNALYLKGASNSKVSANNVTQDITADTGAIDFAVDTGSGLVTTNNVVTDNTFNISNGGRLHAWDSLSISTGNVVDKNTYNISGTGNWGSMFGSTVSSLEDVRNSWAANYDLTDNDSNSE